jgi:ubiquinone biosynthesis protein
LGYLLLLPFWISLIGLLNGRVLGVEIGRLRTAVAALVGWVAGLVGGVLALGPSNQHPLLVIPLSVFLGVIASLPVAIIIDVGTRGRREHPGARRTLRHPVRSTRTVFSALGRFREIVDNARAENLLHVRYHTSAAMASPDFARRLRVMLERSGGMFVKFGQIAATRTDLLPETLTNELSNLHSNVQRLSDDDVQKVLDRELAEPTDKAFAEFDPQPLAAASIGQTHRAKLHDGRAVVVKLQRPGVDDIVRRDSTVLSFAARQIDRRVEVAHRIGIRDLADELVTSIESELDYTRELMAGTQLRDNLGSDKGVQVPAVHPTLSTTRLLVMDEVVGRSIADSEAVDAAPQSRSELARRLLGSFLSQILRDGYYHADPHPGNILIDAQGTLWLIDLGAVGRIDAVTQQALQGIALGFQMNDGSVIARAVRYLLGDDQLDVRELERDMAVLLGEVQSSGFGAAAMLGVMEVIERRGMRAPRSMLLLSRTLITLEGTLRAIAPGFDLGTEAEALVARDHRDELGSPEELIRAELIRALPALRTLPEHAEALATQWRSGRLTVQTEHYAGADRAVVESWLNRTLVALSAAAGALTSAGLLVAGSLSPHRTIRDVLWVLGFAGLAGTAVLLLRTVAQALHSEVVRSD